VCGGLSIRELALAIDEEGIGMAADGVFECIEQSRDMIHGNAIVRIGPIACTVYATSLAACKLDFAVLSAPISRIMGSLSDAVCGIREP
jgi:hypothetical protein